MDVNESRKVEAGRGEEQARLRLALSGMRRLYDLHEQLTGESDLAIALDNVLATACEFMGADGAVLHLLSEDGQRLDVVSRRGYDKEIPPALSELALETLRRASRDARAIRRQLLIEDSVRVRGESLAAHALRAEGIRAAQFTPMVSSVGNTLGVLSTQLEVPQCSSEEELRVMRLLARTAAEFVEHHRAAAAIEAERSRREQLEHEFIANAAHELRTPLSGLVGSLDALDHGALDDPAQRARFLGHLRRETNRLQRLYDSLFTLAQARTPGEIPREDLAVQPFLAEIIAGHAGDAELLLESPANLTIETNRGLLELAIANVVQNAITHAGGSPIELSARLVDRSTMIIQVADRGPGMTGQAAERAFDRFYRVTPRSAAGFGLGLSIADQAARAIGAKLTLKPRPGGGTLARMTLPMPDEVG